MKQKLYLLCYLIVFLLMNTKAYAKADDITIPLEEDLDYEEVQKVMDELLGENTFDWKQYIKGLVTGEETFSIVQLVQDLLALLGKQISNDKSLVLRFIGIGIIGAIFANFSKLFRENHVSETSFYITYLILFTIIGTSFFTLTELAKSTLLGIMEFMRAMIPAYFISIAFSTGSATSYLFYQAVLIIIQIVEILLIKGIIPLIRIYFILSLVNQISKEDLLSKAAELLETVIRWTLKSLLALITGYNVVQGLVVPVADTFKNRLAYKAVNAIPGVGNILGSATETVFGAGIVLKNALGAAGIFVLVLLLSAPALRIALVGFIYKMAAAFIQPISDKRIVESLSQASKAAGLLLYTTFVGGFLFLLSIIVIMATTNIKF